jgi:hypothetical protein
VRLLTGLEASSELARYLGALAQGLPPCKRDGVNRVEVASGLEFR